MKSFSNPAVARVFSEYPAAVRVELLKLRELIFSTAKRTPGVGVLEESLKWGQPSYLTAETKSGSTIRLDALRSNAGGFALYFHCQTDLVENFRQKFGKKLRYERSRALLFSASDQLPEVELSECITAALTYHLTKKGQRTPIGELINKARA
jgi:Domain of unknown function (DU1801)